MGLWAFLALLLGLGGFLSGNVILGVALVAAGILLGWVWFRRTAAQVVAEPNAPAVPAPAPAGVDRRWACDAPPRIAPADVATLPQRPVDWPSLPPMPTVASPERVYVEVADREYARTDCPHCRHELAPLPKAKKRCSHCGREIFVRSGPDNRRYLLRADERAAVEAQWQAAREAEWNDHRARAEAALDDWLRSVAGEGVTVGDMGLDVVGESFYLANLVALRQRYPDGLAVALLQRDPGNQYDRNAIKILIDGVQVGHLSRYDAEDYQALLKSYERAGRSLYLVAQLTGGDLEPDGLHGPVGVHFEHAPEPE